MVGPLSPEQVDQFHVDGFVMIEAFYDLEREIEPIQLAIHRIIGLVIARHDLPIEQPGFTPDTFDSALLELATHDRRFAAEVYDAVKQIPAFGRLIALPKHEALFAQLRPHAFPAIASGGSGIRIDIPGEDRFRAEWHQDYLGQFRSLDGLVLWSSLVTLTPELGPVKFCQGSHRDGLRPVLEHDPDRPDAAGVYAVILADRENIVARYEQVTPLSGPGDLVVIDYQTLHASGHNRADRARWSMQMRYFNFADPTGMSIGWRGSFAAGVPLRSVHPELVVS
jgi:hypothetical protein